VPAEKVCYYAISKDEAGRVRVRYGTSRRAEAQMSATLETWSRVSEELRAEGYRLVDSEEGKAGGRAPSSKGVVGMADDRPVPNVSPAALSATERRVATLLTAGCSDRVIADRIKSSKSVEEHRQAIYAKLGISDPVTLACWVRRFDVARW
jgi:DNA-binding CsgD family transcriptional regulator